MITPWSFSLAASSRLNSNLWGAHHNETNTCGIRLFNLAITPPLAPWFTLAASKLHPMSLDLISSWLRSKPSNASRIPFNTPFASADAMAMMSMNSVAGCPSLSTYLEWRNSITMWKYLRNSGCHCLDKWPDAWLAPSHYLRQWGFIVHWTVFSNREYEIWLKISVSSLSKISFNIFGLSTAKLSILTFLFQPQQANVY